MTTNDVWRELRRVFAGQRLLVIGGPVAGLAALGKLLHELEAESLLLIGSSLGTGALPDPEVMPWVSLDLRASSVNESIAQYEARLARPTPELMARVRAFDPEGRALALGPIVLSELPEVCGRRRFGARARNWAEVEDKVRVDAIWRAAGVEGAPSEVVALEPSALWSAHQRLDQGDGSVWVGDAREGVHGGAERLAWVRSPSEAERARERLTVHCDAVRVMPFIEGIPCSIHGMVTARGVAVFRPVELVVLRRPDEGRFVYAGVTTVFDPSPEDRQALRGVARVVGRELSERVGFRGSFSLDGVLGRDGFVPTEINARVGAGLGLLTAGEPTLPLALLSLALAAGLDLDMNLEQLEASVLEVADRHRAGGARLAVPLEVRETATGVIEPPCAGPGGASFEWSLGPSDLGGFLGLSPRMETLVPGAPLSPLLPAVMAHLDREHGWGLGFERLSAPVRVR